MKSRPTPRIRDTVKISWCTNRGTESVGWRWSHRWRWIWIFYRILPTSKSENSGFWRKYTQNTLRPENTQNDVSLAAVSVLRGIPLEMLVPLPSQPLCVRLSGLEHSSLSLTQQSLRPLRCYFTWTHPCWLKILRYGLVSLCQPQDFLRGEEGGKIESEGVQWSLHFMYNILPLKIGDEELDRWIYG